jgi:hypothetical protein
MRCGGEGSQSVMMGQQRLPVATLGTEEQRVHRGASKGGAKWKQKAFSP